MPNDKEQQHDRIRLTDDDMAVSGSTSLNEIYRAMKSNGLIIACGCTQRGDVSAFLIVRAPLVPTVMAFAYELERQWNEMGAPPKGNDGSPNIKLN